ncbi:MAG TPA: putative ABC transporter permease [Candidatus Eisenbergiella merdigallinarum]|uniref:ABC transporter permease n=1 Tax=Candidatus Eisenbergiella merdigallinarum TaxID=2838552 RepID=A0A9D2MQX0_9FIRM|nr:putative ABC transporter permease [Candidatus Eisenbergiella merdigallinarum]
MEYTVLELVTYLLLYGFLGWALEVAALAAGTGKFRNRGFFSLPICPEYGVAADILILVLPTMKDNAILQFLTALTVLSAVEYLSAALAGRIWRRKLWRYEGANAFGGEKKGILIAGLKAAVLLATVLLLHPLIFAVLSLVPDTALLAVCVAVLFLLAADFASILYAVCRGRRRGKLSETRKLVQEEKRKRQKKLGTWICDAVVRRLERAYPNMEAVEEEKSPVFAKGICLDKLIWVFILCAFVGDLIETVFCRFTAGVWMSRSSVIYGPFSIVWGLGAVLLTVILQKLADRDDRQVFLAGCILGGVYEYLCSVFTELVFGTKFWDYSDMPFNIGGRTNLLYCIFWGILSVVWIKICYPAISRLIEKLPPIGAKAATWGIVVLMICDAVLSGAVMVRYVARHGGNPADRPVEAFLDANYPDEMVEKVWPNMRVLGEDGRSDGPVRLHETDESEEGSAPGGQAAAPDAG